MFNEEKLFDNYNQIIGVDEAGRGPIAGPVVAAGISIKSKNEYELIKHVGIDSKTINEKERKKRYDYLINNFQHSIFIENAENIDIYNIFASTQTAMNNCVKTLISNKLNISLIDGKNFKFNFNFQCIIRGDVISKIIGAASILAKVYRDDYMKNISDIYPSYNFSKHKGYPTKEHFNLIKSKEIISEYRISFNPVKKMILNNEVYINKNNFNKVRLLRIGAL